MNIEDIDISKLYEDFVIFIGERNEFGFELFNVYCIRNRKITSRDEVEKLFTVCVELNLIRHTDVYYNLDLWTFNETS